VVDLTKALKPLSGKIQQQHQAGDKFVAVVEDEETKAELLKRLARYKLKAFVTVAVPESSLAQAETSDSDKVEILYSGTVAIASMKLTGFGKKQNHQFYPRFVKLFEAHPIFEPVVLSKDLTVIDGEQRIAAAIELNASSTVKKIDRLPAVVLNTTPLQAKFLRLVLNKSNEFQRWHWDAVDDFLEEHPELLPQLEPLAIFGERVLPESFFGNTVVEYEIHAEGGVKSQQSFYKQEHGLAKWAKLKRDLIAEETANSKSARKAASLNRTEGMDFENPEVSK
jgi:hypothetical protein